MSTDWTIYLFSGEVQYMTEVSVACALLIEITIFSAFRTHMFLLPVEKECGWRRKVKDEAAVCRKIGHSFIGEARNTEYTCVSLMIKTGGEFVYYQTKYTKTSRMWWVEGRIVKGI